MGRLAHAPSKSASSHSVKASSRKCTNAAVRSLKKPHARLIHLCTPGDSNQDVVGLTKKLVDADDDPIDSASSVGSINPEEQLGMSFIHLFCFLTDIWTTHPEMLKRSWCSPI